MVELVETLASSAGGRFVSSGLNKGQTIHAQQLVRAHTLDEVRLAGEWLSAGGDAWRGVLDVRQLKDLPVWVAQSTAWDACGRGAVAPVKADPPRKKYQDADEYAERLRRPQPKPYVAGKYDEP